MKLRLRNLRLARTATDEGVAAAVEGLTASTGRGVDPEGKEPRPRERGRGSVAEPMGQTAQALRRCSALDGFR